MSIFSLFLIFVVEINPNSVFKILVLIIDSLLHVILFLGIFIVVLSLLIMYYNIGLPNSLRGFLFYSQVSNVNVTINL